MKLYALLIGINLYDENSLIQINNLDGCVNDVTAMRNFLLTHYTDMIVSGNQQLLTLWNEQATRGNVIQAFKTHLCQAQAGDIVFIQYSGHGSSNITAPEFQQYTADNEEQTWVLYDSRTDGGLDLADKELALLLEEVGKTQAHIVVVSDSCHSGSVTREVEDFMNLKVRECKATNAQRTLDSYLNGAFLKRANLKIPITQHILLAACDRTEKAREGNDSHGVFTSAVLDVLEKTGGQLQYSELFVQVRAAIQGFIPNQTPQVEAHGGFNPRQGFLGRNIAQGQFKRYRIRYDKSQSPYRWKIDLGAAMGIQSDLGAPISIKVYDAVADGNLIGEVQLGNLNVTESEIIPKNILSNRSVIYWGEPIALPMSPMFVYADANIVTKVKPTFDKAVESGFYLNANRNFCPF